MALPDSVPTQPRGGGKGPLSQHGRNLAWYTGAWVALCVLTILLHKSRPGAEVAATVVPSPPESSTAKETPVSTQKDEAKGDDQAQSDWLGSGPVVQMPPLAEQRAAVPGENEQKTATASLYRDHDSLFAKGFRETEEEYRARAAGESYRLTTLFNADPHRRFVLLNLAWQNAALSGNGGLALQATEELAVQFRVDPMKAKFRTIEVLAKSFRDRESSRRAILATLLSESDKRDIESQRQHDRQSAAASASPLMALAEEAMGERDFYYAQQVCKLAGDLGYESWDQQARGRFAALSAWVEKAVAQQAAFPEALASLAEKPNDPEASWVAGRHLCLVLDKWDEGLAYLTHAANKDIRDAALMELDAAPKKPEQQFLVGEKWLRAAQSHEGMERECLMLRAILWHRRARSRLEAGPVRNKLDQRLEETLQEFDRLAALPPVFPLFYPLSRVAYWNPNFVATEQKVLHWDITPFVTRSGTYAVWFQCGNGAHRLRVEWVVLGQDGKEGKEISRHVNPSVAEGGKPWPQFTVAPESPEPGKQYGLYARVEATGPASHGCVRMKYLGPQMPAPSAPATSEGKP
jgi:hypothetical protein